MIKEISIAVMLVLVGRILKLVNDNKSPLTPAQKNARIRIAGKLRRVCDEHKKHLVLGNMAILDEANCDYCDMIDEIDRRNENV
jgi:hypothetical protein